MLLRIFQNFRSDFGESVIKSQAKLLSCLKCNEKAA